VKAIALGDKIRIIADSPSDMATMRLVEKTMHIRIASSGSMIRDGGVGEIDMLISADETPTQRDATLAEELKLTKQRLGNLEHLLDAIPPCPAHGKGCLAHALEWISSKCNEDADEDEP
jgi:hypothetical protein